MPLPRKNWLEWTVFAGGLALLLAVVGFLVAETIAADGRPATLSVELGEPTRRDAEPAHVIVSVTVRNDGDRAAEAVLVEVERGAGEAAVRGQVEIHDVPRMSSRTGVVAFPEGAGPGELRARIVGYSEP
jgi:uncharacterized protein (TIGR02588 family)